MKRVLINAQPMTVVGTGIGRYLRGLSKACLERPSEFRLSWFLGDRVVDAIPEARNAGWLERIGQVLWKMPSPMAYGARLLRHAVAEARFGRACTGFDVYHEAGYFPLRARESVRTILTVHDLSLLRFPQWHPEERVRYWNRYFMDRLAQVDGFCAVSEFTKQEMVEHLAIDPGKIVVTHLGYDAALFNAVDDPDARLFLQHAGVPERFILFVGSGDPRKNLASVVAAHQAAGIDAPLVTVGWSGWHQESHAGVVNLGYVSDRVLAQLYRKAAFLVMPSEYEGFGLPVLEAMACGCPVLSSRAGALREVGGSAIALSENISDPGMLGNEMGDLIHSRERRQDMARSGLDRAEKYSWLGTCEATMSVWDE